MTLVSRTALKPASATMLCLYRVGHAPFDGLTTGCLGNAIQLHYAGSGCNAQMLQCSLASSGILLPLTLGAPSDWA
jgi:hypothetical protein